jgi:hypothetical protein
MMSTYKIIRFFKEEGKPAQVMSGGHTLEEAKEWCSKKESHGLDWFDGYTEE